MPCLSCGPTRTRRRLEALYICVKRDNKGWLDVEIHMPSGFYACTYDQQDKVQQVIDAYLPAMICQR